MLDFFILNFINVVLSRHLRSSCKFHHFIKFWVIPSTQQCSQCKNNRRKSSTDREGLSVKRDGSDCLLIYRRKGHSSVILFSKGGSKQTNYKMKQ